MISPKSDIRLSAISKKGWPGMVLRIIGPLFDRILGVRKLRKIYERHKLQGLGKYDFIEKFQRVLRLRFHINAASLEFIPKTGAVVIVANHPLGGLEGILMALALREARPDYKIFVNIMLYFIKELEEFFIFTNPMAPGSRDNIRSVGLCRAWLRDGHCLVVFPAGRVGLYREEKGYITDEAWDQIALSLGLMTTATFVPIFVGGQCGAFFSWMSRLIFPMKLLLLVREFIRSFGTNIEYIVGIPIAPGRIAGMKRRQANAYLRMRTYLLKPAEFSNSLAENFRANTRISQPEPDLSGLEKALGLLPADHILVQDQHYILAWCDMVSNPALVNVLIQLRNRHGAFPLSPYDAGCRHIFVYDTRGKIIAAACRLLAAGSLDACGLYSSALFYSFVPRKTGIGNTSELSLAFAYAGNAEKAEALLWEGILRLGGKALLGTLHISPSPHEPRYCENSLTLVVETLSRKNRIQPGKKKPSRQAAFAYTPLDAFPLRLHREVEEYLDRYGLNPEELKEILSALDGQPRELPFLAKPMLACKANFVSAGMDAGAGLPVLLFKIAP